MMCDDGFAEVQEYQASGGQLCMALRESSAKGALVVVVAVCGGRVFPADVDDGMAGCKEGRVAGADQRRGLIAR